MNRRVIQKAGIVSIIVIAGALSAWIGYQSGAASSEGGLDTAATDQGLSASSRLANTASVKQAGTFHFRSAQKAILAAIKRTESDRSDASYIKLNELMDQFPSKELPKLLVSAEGMPPSAVRDRLLRRVIHILAPKDPDKMYTYCLEHGLTEHMFWVFEELAKDDPVAAWGKVEEFIQAESRQKATKRNYVLAVFREWAEQDPMAALSKALEIDDRMISHVTPAFSYDVEMREMVLAIPEIDETSHREEFVMAAALWMNREDQVAALEWLYDSGINGHWVTRTEILMADFRDPRAAAEFLYSTIREGDKNDHFEKTSHILGNWRDREECAVWLEEQGEIDLAAKARARR